jgi:hypothetical protein
MLMMPTSCKRIVLLCFFFPPKSDH